MEPKTIIGICLVVFIVVGLAWRSCSFVTGAS